jgi:triosephosphate isomerase
MRTPLLAGNWKMNGTLPEAVALVDALRTAIGECSGREVLVAPAFPALAAVSEQLQGSGFLLAAQDLHWEDSGAFTGAVSGPMLRAAGCTHVIVGHSERRQYFGESDADVARKVAAALKHQLTPIMCVGETLEEREKGAAMTVIERQVRGGLNGLDSGALAKVILAYEPVWAIGTGKVATPAQAQEVHRAIRAVLASLGGDGVAAACRILYGGSVKADNVDSLMREVDIDGALVGGASLKAAEFARIVRFEA